MTEKRPNWKNPKDYPPHGSQNMEMWAWEFLRRNRDFLQAAVKVLDEQKRLFEEHALPVAWNEQPLGAVLFEWGIKTPYASLPGGAELMGSPVGFERFPRSLRGGRVNDDSPWLRYCIHQVGKLPLEFDLTAPIGPQLIRAKRILEANRAMPEVQKLGVKTRNNEQTKLFSEYLRLLDARTEMVGVPKLAEFFLCGEDKIEKRLAKAEELRDGGYKSLLEK